jgi:thymidylate kinase
MSGKKLLAHALKYNLRKNALGTLGGMIRFEYTRVRNYLRSRTGFSIGFTGPDGSGKTTVIDMMIEQLGDVFRKAHAYYHFRPSLFGNLGEVAHSAGIKKEVDRNFDQPHRGGKTGVLSSLLRLLYYTIDYILGYFLKVKTVTRITRLVIFDRYYTDIICDSRRSRIYLSPKFLYYFGKVFIPSLDYNILLTASTETILKRKNELDKEGIETINHKIDYLADKKGYYKVLNETIPQETVAHILNIVFEEQHRKNLKRLR